MPSYSYKNMETGEITEVVCPIDEAVNEIEIEGILFKKMPPQRPANIKFKGSGFYETDYKGK